MARTIRTWLFLLFGVSLGALACIHPPSGFKGQLTERQKNALLFHDGADAHLVIGTSVFADGDELPETLAWVIPVPSLPSKYEEAPEDLFRELSGLIPRVRQMPRGAPAGALKQSEAPKAAPAPAFEVHEAQSVGRYKIQPLEILAESGGKELNAWLVKNGFEPISAHDQQYYMKKGAVFVTVKVEGLPRLRSSMKAVPLKPLHIVYRDDRMRLPLKFSGHSGKFNVRLYAATDQPPARKALAGYRLEVSDASYRIDDSMEHRAPGVATLLGTRGGYITEFIGIDYNVRSNVAEMSEDPWLLKTGGARGGEPGGVDHAGLMPEYPLFRLRQGEEIRRPISTGEWAVLASMAAWLALALWWLVNSVRHIVRAVRAGEESPWRRVGNRAMLAGLAMVLIFPPAYLLPRLMGFWGRLAEDGGELFLFGGFAVFVVGLLVRLAAIWRDPEAPGAGA